MGAGLSAAANLREPEWIGQCVFIAPDRLQRSATVTLKAGEAKVIAWPE